MTGRPADYTQAIGDAICERLADGESLRAICLDEGMPSKSAVFRWLGQNDAFRDQYARAREEQAEHYADELVGISDEDDTIVKDMGDGLTAVVFDSVAVARNKLRIDTRKWVASKLKPKKYGDKLELAGNAESPLTVVVRKLSDA